MRTIDEALALVLDGLEPGEIERVPLADGQAAADAPVRIAPQPPRPPHLPVHKRNPLVVFGIAAALGSIAGLLSRFKLR